MDRFATPPPYRPPNAAEALSRIRKLYRKEPDTFTITTLVHGTFKMIAETAENMELEARARGSFDKNTLVFLTQIKDTCQAAAKHLSDLMWPEAPLLSPDQCRKLKLGEGKSTLAFLSSGRIVFEELEAE